MANASAIDTLIDLAAAETDEAAKRLGLAIRASGDAEQKLALLLQYRDEYTARFQARMANGLTAAGYRNFQLFIDKLDQAIAGQQRLVQDAQRRADTQRDAWRESERKRKSYDTLAARAQQHAARAEAKRDQKSTDEHAARQAFYKRQ